MCHVIHRKPSRISKTQISKVVVMDLEEVEVLFQGPVP